MLHKIRQFVQFNLLFLTCYLRVVRGRGIKGINRKIDTRTREVFATIYKPLECRNDYNNRKCSHTVVWQRVSWSFSDLVMRTYSWNCQSQCWKEGIQRGLSSKQYRTMRPTIQLIKELF